MNVAPLLVSRLRGFSLPDEYLQKYPKLIQFVDDNWDLLHRIYRRYKPLLGIHAFSQLEPGRSIPIGMCALEVKAWRKNFKKERDDTKDFPTGRFICGLVINQPEFVLIFPDDGSEEMSFSVFAPYRDSLGELVLRRIKIVPGPTRKADPPEQEDESGDEDGTVIVSDDGLCEGKMTGTVPDQVLTCKGTGCKEHCEAQETIVSDRFATIGCECSPKS